MDARWPPVAAPLTPEGARLLEQLAHDVEQAVTALAARSGLDLSHAGLALADIDAPPHTRSWSF